MTSAKSARQKGYLITLLGVLWLSPDALILRLIDSDPLTIFAYRGSLSALALGIFLLWRDGPSAFKKISWSDPRLLAVACMYAINSATFVAAITYSTVADVLVILAATPFVAAIFGYFLLNERPTRQTTVAIVLGGIGVLVSTIGGVSGGYVLGMILAVITTVMLAAQFTALRLWPQIDNVAAVFIGSIFMGILGMTMGDPLSLTGASLGWALLLGLFLTPIAFTLVTVGPRYITSAEVSLMMLLETVFGPLWVWLALKEEPASTALIGGAIIVVAVCITAASAFRRPV